MTHSGQPTVLVADSNQVSRDTLFSHLRTMGMHVMLANDGGEAIKILQRHPIDVVIFDSEMSPVDGFELARFVQVTLPQLPRILMTANHAADMLGFSHSIGIQHILSKPVEPARLEKLVSMILEKKGRIRSNLRYIVSEDKLPKDDETCMRMAIELARKNVAGGFGGPFASVVRDQNGYIIGEGVNLPSSRYDPIAHAEVMAIRKGAEYLQQTHLEGCTIFSTSQPTKLATALIESVGIIRMVYGVSFDDIQNIKLMNTGYLIETHTRQRHALDVDQCLPHEALAMFLEAQK